MIIRWLLIFTVLISLLSKTYGQEEASGQLIRIIEELAETALEDNQYTSLSDDIAALVERPVNINSGDETEIARLFFLTIFQVKSIVDYTRHNGKFISIYEIRYLPGFDKEMLDLISPFITLSKTDNGPLSRKGISNRYLINYIISSSATEVKYIGSRSKILNKLGLCSGPFSAGLTIEKDRGEKILGATKFPDFTSANLSYTGAGVIRKIIIGDYKVRFGQGLTVWNGFSPSISPINNKLMKGTSTIVPYTSSDENNYFRGVAVTAKAWGVNLNSYVSDNMIDANTYTEDGSEQSYISSFYKTGLHNTQNTLLKRNNVNEKSAGLNINKNFGKIYLGLNLAATKFSLPVKPDDDSRSYYDFMGMTNSVISVDNAILFKNSYLFGECSYSRGGGFAFLQGFSLAPRGRIKLNILYSSTGLRYNSFHGISSGKETVNNYRSSLLLNLGGELWSNLYFITGLVRQREYWYNNTSGDFPASLRFDIQLRFEANEHLSAILDIRQKQNNIYITPEQGIKTVDKQKINKARLNLRLKLSERLSFSSRFELCTIPSLSEGGFMFYQSADFSFRNIPLRLIGRITVFSSDSYSTRLYTWENDLLYNPVVKALYNSGTRSYLMSVYKPTNSISIRCKYANTCRKDKTDEFFSDEIKLQMIINF